MLFRSDSYVLGIASGKADAGQCYYSSGVYESGAVDVINSNATVDGWGNLVMIGIRIETGNTWDGETGWSHYQHLYARWINLNK